MDLAVAAILFRRRATAQELFEQIVSNVRVSGIRAAGTRRHAVLLFLRGRTFISGAFTIWKTNATKRSLNTGRLWPLTGSPENARAAAQRGLDSRIVRTRRRINGSPHNP